MKVYLVCRGTGGAHQSSSVFSVWTTREGALAEAQRLAALYPPDDRDIDEIEIAECEADTPNDDDGVTWATEYWRQYRG